jgi:hypothetical protein
MSEETAVPVIGGAVLVTFYNGAHELSSLVAHVLAITGAAAGLTTADGQPALTVAYPDPTADPSILSSANWQRAYVRKTGVVHFRHQSAVDGQQSIVWGYPVELAELPQLIKPTGPASNPALERQIVGAKGTEMQIDDTVRLRSEVTGDVQKGLIATDGTIGTGVADLSPEQQTTAQQAASVPVPAQDAAIEAADQSAHNAAVAADQAAHVADDAAANAAEVHSS